MNNLRSVILIIFNVYLFYCCDTFAFMSLHAETGKNCMLNFSQVARH